MYTEIYILLLYITEYNYLIDSIAKIVLQIFFGFEI